MKKALPWIIAAIIIVIIIIVLIMRKRKSGTKPPEYLRATAPTNVSFPTAGTGSFVQTAPASKKCACEDDPEVAQLVGAYNSMSNSFPFTTIKPIYKQKILELCPCIEI